MKTATALLVSTLLLTLTFIITHLTGEAIDVSKYNNYKNRLMFKCKNGEIKSCKELEISISNNCAQWNDGWDCHLLGQTRKYQNLDYVKYEKLSCLKGNIAACEEVVNFTKD